MREIKFRAWDKDEKLMVYFSSHWEIDAEYYNLGFTREYKEKKFFESYEGAKEEAILMQYTGIKDKNGKEIWEGDIVKGGISYDWRKNETGIVEFGFFESDNSGDEYSSNNIYGWNIKPIKLEEDDDKISGNFGWGELEIIGNIYENPNLIKEAK